MSLFADLGRSHSIAALKDFLALICAGKRLTVATVYETNTVGTPYTLRNVKDPIRALEAEERVTVDPPADKRRKLRGEVTLADDKMVAFPL